MHSNKQYNSHLITPKTLVIAFEGDDEPISIRSDSTRYKKVRYLLSEGLFSEVPIAVDKALGIVSGTKGKFNICGDCIYIDGEILPKTLSDKLIALVDSAEETDALENFWDNLKENPAESSKEDLFSFLEYNNVPITRDGCFIVYKRVRKDWFDVHSRSISNKPGSVVEMERSSVDPNRNNTCSAGLHVAAFEYAHNFSGERLLECKVSPRDVVAVPPDYSNQKMRTCRYEVLRETSEKYGDVALYDEPEAQTSKLGGGVFKTMRLAADTRGRLRIPGKALRKIGVGVGAAIEALVTTPSSRYVRISVTPASDGHDWTTYTVESDNSVRVGSSILASAQLDGLREYVVRLVKGNLEIRGK